MFKIGDTVYYANASTTMRITKMSALGAFVWGEGADGEFYGEIPANSIRAIEAANPSEAKVPFVDLCEEFYDEEIAPALLELAHKCQDRGLSFVSSVEYAPGDTGETIAVAADASFKLRLAAAATQAHGNADSLLIWLVKYAKEHGHSSIFIDRLMRDAAE